MGVVLPGWADEILDIIGVSWPNVDEDDYRQMADAMREFADDIDDGAGEAHEAIQGLVGSAGGSLAVEALNAHWSKINGTHLRNLAECGRMAGTALDGVALLIEGAKLGAIVQLGVLAAEVIAAQVAAPFTLGLSEVGALAATQATRMIVKRLFKEVCEQVAEQVISIALTPVEEALGAMVGDLVVQLGANALGVQNGVDLGRTAQAGKDGFGQGVQDAKDSAKSAASSPMELLSAGGRSGSGLGGSGSGGSGGSGGFTFDEGEHDRVITGLQSAGGTFRNKAGGKIGRAKSHHGRTRGKDAIANAANAMLDKVIEGIEGGLKKAAKHLDDSMTRGVKQMAKNHRDNDDKLAEHFKGLGKGGKKDPKAPNGSGGAGGRGGKSRKGKGRDQLDKEHPDNNSRHDKDIDGCGDPVDVATGRVFLKATDIALPGALPLLFVRKYESSYRVGQQIGPSWSSTADQRLEIDEHGVVFVTEGGMLLSYDIPEPGQRSLPARGPRWPLTRTLEGDWAIHDPDSGHTRHFSDAAHTSGMALLDEISDGKGHYLTFDYDDRTGALVSVRHSAGYRLNAHSDEHGRLTALSLAPTDETTGDIQLVGYGHDQDGNLTTVTDASGRSTCFEYDAQHRMTAWVDSNGSRYEYIYDQASRCISQGGADGHLHYRYDYDQPAPLPGHRVTAVTNSLGHTTCYVVNGRLKVTSQTDPLGRTTRSDYDADDRLVATTDALGRTTRFTYDASGRLTSITRPDNSQSTLSYNDRDQLTDLTGPDGGRWQHTYDSQGNRTALTDPVGATTTYTYDQRGHLTSTTDALGNTTTITTNDAGLPLTFTNPLGAVTQYRYDALGRLTAITNPLGDTTQLTWTLEGRLAARSNPDGTTERWAYDGEGNCTTHTDALGKTTRYTYTHFDQFAQRITADGTRHTFTHDTELRLTQVTNPQGLTWNYSYDAAGQLVSETDFDGHTLTYTYDAAGQLATRINALGQTTTYTHDALGNLTEKTADDRTTVYAYDPVGRLQCATNSDAVLSYTYDPLGRVIAETVNGQTVATACDALGRRTHRTTPVGATTTYTYDAAGNRTTLTASGRTLTSDYDLLGSETTRRLNNAFALHHTVDAMGRRTQQTLATPHIGGDSLLQRTYSYRPDGHLTGINDLHLGNRHFDLDTEGHVTAVRAENWTEAYAYDESGNQTHATWPDRHPNAEARGERTYTGTRITRAGNIRYEYDAQGRVILRQKIRLSRKPDTWRYTWDAEDHLTTVITPDGTQWRYLYDPLGRRIAKQRLATDQETVLEETRFAWDGSTLTEQSTRTRNSEELTLTWDHDGITPIAQTERKTRLNTPQHLIDERFFAVVTDLIGTPTELVDESGNVAWQARSTLWGTTSWNHSATAYTPLRFPGQYFDPETQLHFNYFRTYDPESGRYLTLDPLGLAPAPNPATYVPNPLTWFDPLGLAPCNEPADPTWGGRVRYGEPDEHGRPTAMHATLGRDMMGANPTDPHGDPPGWEKDKGYNRAHLLGAQLGGSNRDSRNFVTMHAYANSPVMRHIENQVRKAVEAGETIQYSVTPVYEGSEKIPKGVTIEAHGSNGFSFTQHKSAGISGQHNVAFIPNKKRGG
ncbi:DNA/RNA non-specific endonuclease [Streptomyces sp. NPDC001339]|uniref:DNA/RNA non-specific endonuclease n=1 Tax=Streptomyces sp. NPDC001339 TaxID=3364563 RepID=UPI0036A0711F